MLSELRTNSDIISSYTVSRFERLEDSIRVRARIYFTDDSMLDVRETTLGDNKRKYAYHWQNETFPHHKHISQESNVEASYERTLTQVLQVIRKNLETAEDENTSK